MPLHSEIFKKKRAGYGKEIFATMSQQLTKEYRQGVTIEASSLAALSIAR